MKWEYRIVNLEKSDSDQLLVESFLNAYGVSGWEVSLLLSTEGNFYKILLKRNKEK